MCQGLGPKTNGEISEIDRTIACHLSPWTQRSWSSCLLELSCFLFRTTRSALGVAVCWNCRVLSFEPFGMVLACMFLGIVIFRKGGWYSWKLSSSSNNSIRVVRACPLIEAIQTAPCRAIRGNSILSQTVPSPLSLYWHGWMSVQRFVL